MDSTDVIEKQIFLRAAPARVWRALTDAQEFGTWFKVRLEGTFAPGARLRGPVTYPGYEHLTMDITVERMETERLLSYRWHPAATDAKADYSGEPTTLVEFQLTPREGGTELRVRESGFDKLPAARRAEAYRMNDGGWAEQLKNIERHVAGPQ